MNIFTYPIWPINAILFTGFDTIFSVIFKESCRHLQMPVCRAAGRTLQLPNCTEAWAGEFIFIQAADCQLGMEWTVQRSEGFTSTSWKDHYQDSTWEYEIKWCEKFVDSVNSMETKPVFAIMCGDLLDAFPEKWPEVRDKQYADFQKIFKDLDVPLVCVCGNHDVGNSPTQQTVQKYRSDFGDDWFTFVCNGVFCIVINSQYYEDPKFVPEIAAEQDSWLDEQLKIAKSGKYKHSLVFQHIPLYVDTPDEPKIYFNFLPELRASTLKRFSDSGISKIFCGHYHRNGGGWYNENMELVVTSAVGSQLGGDKNGFRVVTVKETEISHEYVNL